MSHSKRKSPTGHVLDLLLSIYSLYQAFTHDWQHKKKTQYSEVRRSWTKNQTSCVEHPKCCQQESSGEHDYMRMYVQFVFTCILTSRVTAFCDVCLPEICKQPSIIANKNRNCKPSCALRWPCSEVGKAAILLEIITWNVRATKGETKKTPDGLQHCGVSAI